MTGSLASKSVLSVITLKWSNLEVLPIGNQSYLEHLFHTSQFGALQHVTTLHNMDQKWILTWWQYWLIYISNITTDSSTIGVNSKFILLLKLVTYGYSDIITHLHVNSILMHLGVNFEFLMINDTVPLKINRRKVLSHRWTHHP